VKGEDYQDFVNATLDADEAYHSNTQYYAQVMKYLTYYKPSTNAYYNPQQMRNIKFETNLRSFKNGVLLLPSTAGEPATFYEYGSPAFAASGLANRVAGHHIHQAFDPCWIDPEQPEPPTPALDRILHHQFTLEVAATLHIMMGRLLWPVGQLDCWQVLLWLVGVGGTGKSMILEVVDAMYADECVATLSANQEGTFGLQGMDQAQVLIGRDRSWEVPARTNERSAQAGAAAANGERGKDVNSAERLAGAGPQMDDTGSFCQQRHARLQGHAGPDQPARGSVPVRSRGEPP
jgi:hypothetical protein